MGSIKGLTSLFTVAGITHNWIGFGGTVSIVVFLALKSSIIVHLALFIDAGGCRKCYNLLHCRVIRLVSAANVWKWDKRGRKVKRWIGEETFRAVFWESFRVQFAFIILYFYFASRIEWWMSYSSYSLNDDVLVTRNFGHTCTNQIKALFPKIFLMIVITGAK